MCDSRCSERDEIDSTTIVADHLPKVYVPFSGNALAQTAAIASLDAADELMVRCRETMAKSGRVYEALLEVGYAVPETQANFVWLPLGRHTHALVEYALEHTVVVRPFSDDSVRVTIGTPRRTTPSSQPAQLRRSGLPATELTVPSRVRREELRADKSEATPQPSWGLEPPRLCPADLTSLCYTPTAKLLFRA